MEGNAKILNLGMMVLCAIFCYCFEFQFLLFFVFLLGGTEKGNLKSSVECNGKSIRLDMGGGHVLCILPCWLHILEKSFHLSGLHLSSVKWGKDHFFFAHS